VLNSLVYDFVTLLAVVNPVEAAAAFALLTAGESPQQKVAVAIRSSIVALIILVGFGFAGEGLLSALGIGFPAFRIAGGLLLLRVGFNMVFAKETGTDRLAPDERVQATRGDDPSVFPLAIPLITGPGALTTVVAIMSKRHESAVEVTFVVAICVVVMVITLASMLASRMLTRILGATGINAVGRVMGIIVAAIAIQLVIDGVQAVFPVLNPPGA
jgi:multiple antibiotic resistance protein